MLDQKQLWPLVGDATQALVPFYREGMRKAIADSGVPDNWFPLSLARGSAPAPFTVERFHALTPYSARERLIESLEELAGLELLERAGENAYQLTERGRDAVEGIYGAAHRGLATVDPLPGGDMDQLNGLLRRLVDATLEAPEPEEKWAVACSRWTDPGKSASGAARTDQYLTDLVRYRDDAHIAAWKPYDVSGQAWEALTFVWRSQANTAAELAEKLPSRGYCEGDYAEALEHLVGRGWLERTEDGYRVTDAGEAMRQEAEDATERHYFAPWACLTEAEVDQLHELLTRLKNSLDKLAENDEGAT